MVEGYDYEDLEPVKPSKFFGGVFPAEDPVDVNSAFPSVTLADQKAEEAKASIQMTPVEKFVASANETNYGLFRKALDEAIDQTLSCYSGEWMPILDAQEIMVRMDHARNFLALAETYFMALSRPLMQAADLYIQHQMHAEANAPREPSADQRGLRPGSRVVVIPPCDQAGMHGTIMEAEDQDGDVLVKNDNGDVEYHRTTCLQPE